MAEPCPTCGGDQERTVCTGYSPNITRQPMTKPDDSRREDQAGPQPANA